MPRVTATGLMILRTVLACVLLAHVAGRVALAQAPPPEREGPDPCPVDRAVASDTCLAERGATRAERLRAARRVRAAARPRTPEPPSFLERQILAFEKAERPSILDFEYKGFRPRFQSISSGSRIAPAVRFWQPRAFGTPVSVHASVAYSIAGYELYDAQVGLIPYTEGKLPPRSTRGDDVYELGSLTRPERPHVILYASARYRDNPKERFFGVGPHARREDLSLYRLQDGLYELVGGYQFSRRITATVRTGILQVSSGPGDDDDRPGLSATSHAGVPGLGARPDFWRTQGTLLVDARDRPFNPHRGAMLALSAARFDDRDGQAFSFSRMAVDARAYLPLGSPERGLAARVFTSIDRPDDDAVVPYFLMESLGTSHTLRGFQNLRFRDQRLLSLQAEYRWEPAPALELALFWDAGKVFSGGFGLDDLESGYGMGLRLKTLDATLARLDVAKSREGTRVYLRFGASF